ncbi:MAG: helix-turn-helix domain-containing protein [Propionibacteriaceae bacterium]|nr:helix-turn-helix domain-containing protein [Propionibacteriaceae bacterium]
MTDTNQNQTPQRLLSVTELSEFLGIPVSTIYDWRTHGKGPMAYRLGKHLKFMSSDVKAWMALHRDDARNRGESQ